MSLAAETLGFSYLEPKRHIPYVSDLDGEEARSFGEVLASVSKALRGETGAEVVYVYIFGDGVPHLHVHLAPHSQGDALNSQIIRGDLIEEKLPNGFTRVVSAQFPALPREELVDVANRVGKRCWLNENPVTSGEPARCAGGARRVSVAACRDLP